MEWIGSIVRWRRPFKCNNKEVFIFIHSRSHQWMKSNNTYVFLCFVIVVQYRNWNALRNAKQGLQENILSSSVGFLCFLFVLLNI